MKRNNVDAALIIEVSKPIAYGQYQFEKGDKLTYDMNSNLFIYRSESYSKDEDGTETTSIIAFGVDPDFVLDNADHFTCLIKKGILDKVDEDTDNIQEDINETKDEQEDKPEVDTDLEGDKNDSYKILKKRLDTNWLIDHADKLSNSELKDEIIEAMTIFLRSFEYYDLSLRKRFIGKGLDDCDGLIIERRINDVIGNLRWILSSLNEDKKIAIEREKKKSINGCCGETCDSAR